MVTSTGWGTNMGEIVGPVLGFLGAEKSADAAYDAAQLSARAQTDAARMAADAQAFRPVGITNRFGTSNFTMDGNKLTGAGYTPSAELKAYQDFLSSQGAGAQQDVQGLLSLGRGYLGESPDVVRQRYIDQQSALLDPKNEQALAGIRNNLFQTGRGGLATGATTAGGLAATNPEMAAYYNALAQQNAALTAGADAAAQQQITFGQGLLSSAYSPLQSNIGFQAELDKLAMTPLQVGAELGGRSATAGANVGQSLLAGGIGAAKTMQGANSYSPWGSFLSGLSTNQQATQGIANMFGNNNSPSWTTGSNVMPQSTFSTTGNEYADMGTQQGWW